MRLRRLERRGRRGVGDGRGGRGDVDAVIIVRNVNVGSGGGGKRSGLRNVRGGRNGGGRRGRGAEIDRFCFQVGRLLKSLFDDLARIVNDGRSDVDDQRAVRSRTLDLELLRQDDAGRVEVNGAVATDGKNRFAARRLDVLAQNRGGFRLEVNPFEVNPVRARFFQRYQQGAVRLRNRAVDEFVVFQLDDAERFREPSRVEGEGASGGGVLILVEAAKIKLVRILKIAPKPKAFVVATDVDDAPHRRSGTDDAKVAGAFKRDLTFGPTGRRLDADRRVGGENRFDFRAVGVDGGFQLLKIGGVADDFREFRFRRQSAADEERKRREKRRH